MPKVKFREPEIVFYDRDKVEVFKTFDDYAKSFLQRCGQYFHQTAHERLTQIIKINQTIRIPFTIVSNLTTKNDFNVLCFQIAMATKGFTLAEYYPFAVFY